MKINRNEVFDFQSSPISSARPLKLEQHITFVTENLVSWSCLWICWYFKGVFYVNVNRSFNNINYSLLCIHFQKKPIAQVLQNTCSIKTSPNLWENICAGVPCLINCSLQTCNFYQRETPAQVFSCEYYETFRYIFFTDKPSEIVGRFGGGSFILGFGWGDRRWVSYFFYFLFCFCTVVNCSFMAGTW